MKEWRSECDGVRTQGSDRICDARYSGTDLHAVRLRDEGSDTKIPAAREEQENDQRGEGGNGGG